MPTLLILNLYYVRVTYQFGNCIENHTEREKKRENPPQKKPYTLLNGVVRRMCPFENQIWRENEAIKYIESCSFRESI